MPVRKSNRTTETAVYIISVVADLTGVHPQTLRMYERKGLLAPKRTAGNSRRYSERDVQRLQRIQELTQQTGVNLAGVAMIIELERRLEDAHARLDRTCRRLEAAEAELENRRSQGRGVLVRLSDVRSIFEGPAWNNTHNSSVKKGV